MPVLHSRPAVSVLMGVRYTKPGLGHLERAVVSVLEQTYSNLELIICTYGCTQAALKCLERFAQKDPRIHLLCGRSPGTLAQNLNDCLAQAHGSYIARMDDDDFSHPDRLETQLAFLNTHSDIAFVGCNAILRCAGKKVGMRALPEFPMVRDFYMTQPFLHPTLIFRREVLIAVEGYSEGKHQVLCEDYDLLLRLYAKGHRGANLQETLFDYTIPLRVKGNRKMCHRWNESVTRWKRFQELKLFPKALPWVIKPLAVGLLPERLLIELKKTVGSGEC